MSGSTQPYPIHAALEIEDAKNALRAAIRTNRQQRSPRLRQEAAEAFADVLDGAAPLASVRCVAAYVARPHEPGTLPLLERLAARGVRVLLPVLGAGLERGWAEYAGADDLQERAPGRPPEPGTPAHSAEILHEADVVIAPALAVDTTGIRLGQGGGWYDRALSHKRDDALVVAMVFPEEIYDGAERPIPHEPHDVPVDAVATPTGWTDLGVRAAAASGSSTELRNESARRPLSTARSAPPRGADRTAARYSAGVSVSVSTAAEDTASGVKGHANDSPATQAPSWSA